MQIVPTTFMALALIVLLVLVRPRHQLAVLGIALPFGAAAAFNLPAFGNSSVLVPSLVAAALIGFYFLQRRSAIPMLLTAARPYTPGFFLIVFIAIAISVTIVSPRFFAGSIEVFGIARGDRQIAGTDLVPLRPSTANVTQSLYLLQGIIFYLVVVAISQGRDRERQFLNALQAVTLTHLALTALDVVENITGLNALMDWMRTANYAFLDHAVFAGLPRLVGGFSEASSYSYYSLALFAFWLVYWRLGGAQKYAFPYLIALLLAVIFSTSSSAYAALGVFLVIVLSLAAVDLLRRRAPTPTVIMVVGGLMAAPISIALFFLALELSPGFYAYMDQLAFSKLESRSGVERAAWNRQALAAFFDSYMLGVGLGSVRGSSFLVGLLSTVGLAGTLAYGAFFYLLARQKVPPHNSEDRSLAGAAKAACLAMFLQSNLAASNPDLGLLFFLFAGAAFAFSVQPQRDVAMSVHPTPAAPGYQPQGAIGPRRR